MKDNEMKDNILKVLKTILEVHKEKRNDKYINALRFLNETDLEKGELINCIAGPGNPYNNSGEASMIVAILYSLYIGSPKDNYGRISFLLDCQVALANQLQILDHKNFDYLYPVITGELYDFIEEYIVTKEGSSCSVDKAKFVMRTLIDYFQNGVNISFRDLTYELERGQEWTKDWKEETFLRRPYWVPESFLDIEDLLKKYDKFRIEKRTLEKEIYEGLD